MTKKQIFAPLILSAFVLLASCAKNNKPGEAEDVIGKRKTVSSERVTVISNDKELSGRIVYHAPNSQAIEYLEDMIQSTTSDDIPEEAQADGFTAVATVRTMVDGQERLLSASCVQVFGTKAVISYHLHNTGIGGALELLDITDPLHPVSISQIYLNNRDFNHVVFEDEENLENSKFWALADDPVKGYAYLVEGSLTNSDFSTSLSEMRIHGSSTNSAVRMGEKLLIATTGVGSKSGYFQTYDCSTKTLSTAAESMSVQRAKHLSIEGNNLIALSLEECGNNNTSASGTSSGKAVLRYYENFETFANPTATHDLGRIVPIDGKNVILLQAGVAYVALSDQGVKAIDVNSGAVLGSYAHSKGLANGLDVDDRFIYIANGRGGFVVLDKTNFTYKYTFFAKNEHISTNYVCDDENGTLYIADGIDGTRIISKSNEVPESCLEVMGLIKGPDEILHNWVSVFEDKAHSTAKELFADATAIPAAIEVTANTDLYVTFLNTTAATKNAFCYFVVPSGADRLEYFKNEVYNDIWPGKWAAKKAIPQKYLIFENVTATKANNPTLQTGDYFTINGLKAGEQVVFFQIQGATNDDGISYCGEHSKLIATDPAVNAAQTRDYYPYATLDNRFFVGDTGTAAKPPVPLEYRNVFSNMFHSVPCNSLVLHFEDASHRDADSDYADIIVSLSDNRNGVTPTKIRANKTLRTVAEDGSLLD